MYLKCTSGSLLCIFSLGVERACKNRELWLRLESLVYEFFALANALCYLGIMIESIKVMFGSAPDSPHLQLSPGPVTIFIGPNNAGKSLLLRETANFISNPMLHRGKQKILENLSVVQPKSMQDFRSELMDYGAYTDGNILSVPLGAERQVIPVPEVVFSSFPVTQDQVVNILGQAAFIKMDGQTRLALVHPQPTGDLVGRPKNALHALFVDDIARKRLRVLTHEAFGMYAVIDPTAIKMFRLRMSARPPADDDEEQSLSARARSFHQNAIDIEVLSDGVKAYTGILSALLSGKYRIITLDEPEAFLHPSLARRLAIEVTRIAHERKANILTATHSADFLMGCIEAGVGAQIVRLTYQRGVATARHLPAIELVEMMRNPLLRTTNVLAALFQLGAVVTEAESDRAFYDEINHRLLSADGSGSPSTSFLFAQNKQTTHMIVRPLRRLGIPAAAIVDMDFIKEGGKVFTSLLDAAGVPKILHQALGAVRVKLKDAFDAANPAWKTQGGIAVLGGESAQACQDFVNQLAEYGIFIVPGGELESWLPCLGVNRSKHVWLYEVFEKMGSDPTNAHYVRPSGGDVWDFVRKVAEWIRNPKRKGIPS